MKKDDFQYLECPPSSSFSTAMNQSPLDSDRSMVTSDNPSEAPTDRLATYLRSEPSSLTMCAQSYLVTLGGAPRRPYTAKLEAPPPRLWRREEEDLSSRKVRFIWNSAAGRVTVGSRALQ